MMTLETVREAYQYNTGTASDLARKLALAGIGVIWVFAITQPDGSVGLPDSLVLSASLIVLCLTLDLFQYLAASAIWGIFGRRKEKRFSPGEQFEAPAWLNWPHLVLFWAKQVMMVLAYVGLLRFLWAELT